MVDPIPRAAAPAEPPPAPPTPAELVRQNATAHLVNQRAYHLNQLKELAEVEVKKAWHTEHVAALEAELAKLGWVRPDKE